MRLKISRATIQKLLHHVNRESDHVPLARLLGVRVGLHLLVVAEEQLDGGCIVASTAH